MTPSISVRLQSVLNGLRDVIVPAINKDEVLAVEQAGLILAQLSMILRQLPHTDRYYHICQDDAAEAAAETVRQPAGGPRSQQAADALSKILAKRDLNPHAGYLALAAGVASLTRAASEDGDPAWRTHVNETVLAFACRQNRRERIWFLDAGFDVNAAELPDLKTYILHQQS